jgi:hypothetical protein
VGVERSTPTVVVGGYRRGVDLHDVDVQRWLVGFDDLIGVNYLFEAFFGYADADGGWSLSDSHAIASAVVDLWDSDVYPVNREHSGDLVAALALAHVRAMHTGSDPQDASSIWEWGAYAEANRDTIIDRPAVRSFVVTSFALVFADPPAPLRDLLTADGNAVRRIDREAVRDLYRSVARLRSRVAGYASDAPGSTPAAVLAEGFVARWRTLVAALGPS